MKVLIADDSKVNRRVLVKYVNPEEHEIILASDGDEAIDLYKEHSRDLDLIIMDVEMPKKDGYTAARIIRDLSDEEQEWIPIIFLSARIDDDSISKGIESGGDDYLSKPISPAVLHAKMYAMKRIAEMRERLFKMTAELQELNADLSVANQILEELSVKDALTNLGNRRAFDAFLKRECAGALRGQKYLSLIMVDVDKFKVFNDTYGHQVGDKCLQVVGRAMQQSLPRATDFVARYGGEEFGIILPLTDKSGAEQVAEKLRQKVEEVKVPLGTDDSFTKVTISLGIITTDNPDFLVPDKMIHSADEALYQSKENGRNQWTFYE
jgi:diguanylate cyclase (GGDEF)-like protein